MASGPVCAMVWEGLNAVKTGRVMLGETNPAASLPGTIRGDYAIHVGRNICHGSDAVESANSSHSCVWLLHTTQEAEIQIVCTSVHLPQCKATDKAGTIPSWNTVLIISPTWQFTKSWVYCGQATNRLGPITHISTCNKMAVIYRADNMDQGEFT